MRFLAADERKRHLSLQSKLITKHSELVWKLHNEGKKPQQIANELMVHEGMDPARSNAVTGKQISDWINTLKKDKHKTLPVTDAKNSIKVSDGDFYKSCM